jgi:hypothetical protein
MTSRTLATLVSTTVTASALVALAVPAAAAPSHRAGGWVTVTPNPALVYGDKSTWITVKVHLDTNRPIYQGGVIATFRSIDGSGYDSEFLNGPDANGVASARVEFSSYLLAVPGRWRVETKAITTDGGDEEPGPTGYFSFKQVTKISLKAKARTVKKGQPIKLSGLLRVAEFGYVPFPKQAVRIYFRKTGSKKWVYAGQAKTNSEGRFAKAVKAKASGSWLVRRLTTRKTAASASKAITVRVR